MERRRTIKAGLLAAAFLLGAPVAANAAIGIKVTQYEVGPGQDTFQAFDPSLGKLLSVHIEISGDIIPLILGDSTGDVDPLFITQSFIPFAGKGFATLSPAHILGNILTTGVNQQAIPIAPYEDAFDFNALTDFTGFTGDAYGAELTAKLADFLPGRPNGNQIIEFPTYTAWALGVTGAQLPSIQTMLVGGGLVTYTYEIPEAPPPSGAPEPTVWMTLLAGFSMLGARMRRRRTA